VLEVACGPGPGLGLLASRAARLVAGDYTRHLLERAAEHYGARVPLIQLDAARLPFASGVFDVVLLFEAIYFLPDVPAFLAECRRVLAPNGQVIIVSANPEWDAFNPNESATRYWSARELQAVLEASGFRAELLAAFPAAEVTLRGRVMKAVKRFAVRFHLVPHTMKGKELLKRVAFGKLDPFPAEVVAATGHYHAPVPLMDRAAADFKILYAIAHKTSRAVE